MKPTRIGRTDEGLTLLNEALEHTDRTGEEITHAEMLRIKGEILLMHNAEAIQQAEACFRAALEVAGAGG